MVRNLFYLFAGILLLGSVVQPVLTHLAESDEADSHQGLNSVTVSIQDFAFVPTVVTVTVGTEITWHNAGTVTHRVISGLTQDNNCTHGYGYWRNHLDAWPVENIDMGGVVYNKEETLAILLTPPQGDITYILARQLIPAKLNMLQGADPSAIATVVIGADAWLIDYPLGSNPQHIWGLVFARMLGRYNDGLIGPGACSQLNETSQDLPLNLHTSSVWDSGDLLPGEEFSYLFDNAGAYDYHNPLYPYMRGHILVVETQPTAMWQLLETAHAPPIIGEYTMTYDSSRQTLVLYGGNTNGWPYENDTWEFNATEWTLVATAQQPEAVYGADMVYDAGQEAMILFGGSDMMDMALDQTWRYSTAHWEQLTPTQSPPARANHTMAYNSLTGWIYLFGGNNTLNYYNDLWQYNGETWQQITAGGQVPAPRALADLAFDHHGQLLYLFGGRAADGTLLSDFWSFDPDMATWTEITSPGPSPRQAHSLVYQPLLNEIILVGGVTEAGDTLLGDTWHFRNGEWILANSLAGTAYHTLVYAGSHEAVILFTNGQTWQYR